MDERNDQVEVPVLREQLQISREAVPTGGVRVVKHTETHDEIIEQELRRSHVDVQRVQVNRVVDGPLQPRREGNTLIVPVVSEVLHIEKQWVLTEEIHIVESVTSEVERQAVPVSSEVAEIQRVDAEGKVEETAERGAVLRRAAAASATSAPKRRVLGEADSLLRKP